jgi:hypothetical protein
VGPGRENESGQDTKRSYGTSHLEEYCPFTISCATLSGKQR